MWSSDDWSRTIDGAGIPSADVSPPAGIPLHWFEAEPQRENFNDGLLPLAFQWQGTQRPIAVARCSTFNFSLLTFNF